MKLFKSLSVLAVPICVITLSTSGVKASNNVQVKLDANLVKFPDAQPFINEDMRVEIPVRFIAESLGYDVIWKRLGDKTTVTIAKGNKQIVLQEGQNNALVNGSLVNFDTKVIVKDDRTYVPLRFVAETFGMGVDWDPAASCVTVKSNQSQSNQTQSNQTQPKLTQPIVVPTYESFDLRLATPLIGPDIDAFIQRNQPNSPLIGMGQTFIDAQNLYGVNGQFLAAHAILESNWGLSQIAKDKNNLFGYMAYDSDPYDSAATFRSYKDCIYYQAYFVHTDYLTPTGMWYVGATMDGMNVHYASDPKWAVKIADLMQRMHPFNQIEYMGKQPLPITGAKPAAPIINTLIHFPDGAAGITTDTVNLYANPSVSSNNQQIVAKGTKLILKSKNNNNWYQVQVGSSVGWVDSSCIKLLNVLQVINVSDVLNIRSSPSVSSQLVDTVPSGAYLIAKLNDQTGQPISVNGWYVITWKGQDRYVFGSYIKSPSP